MKWAKPVAVLLSPDGGVGSGNMKEFPARALSGSLFTGVAHSILLKIEGVVQRTRRVATLDPLLGQKVTACVRVYLTQVSWNKNQASKTLLCSHSLS